MHQGTYSGNKWGITFPFEKLLAKSTSLSNLIVKGCFFAFFFLFCCSAVDVEFVKPKTRTLFNGFSFISLELMWIRSLLDHTVGQSTIKIIKWKLTENFNEPTRIQGKLSHFGFAHWLENLFHDILHWLVYDSTFFKPAVTVT